jgi:tripartite-type tricarboxylate transporter receptor subunit TctC
VPAIADLVAGHVDLMFDNSDRCSTPCREARALAIANEQRCGVSDLPPGGDSGWPPAGRRWPCRRRRRIVDRLWQAAAEALRMPDVEARLRSLGAAPGGSTPAATAAFLRQETERWSKVIAQANIKPE